MPVFHSRCCVAGFAAAVMLTPALHAQQSQTEQEQQRQEKLEDILRIQDLRTPHDGRLIALLGDTDPLVRRRATFAFGSLQDTSVMGLLTRNLEDPDSATEEAAAFALGQTGTMLSSRGREDLEHDLIWLRMPRTMARGRLIEEIGKFGTATGLEDLLVRTADENPVRDPERLMMSIARFAIRGITSDRAVLFLLRFIDPTEETPWEAVYALQRIGEQPLIRADLERLRLLVKHDDPLVRMNVALLLGRLHDTGGASEVLQRMADHDTDWRVRVNAFRALGNFSWKGNTGVIDLFTRAFYDSNPHIALTALSVFPLIGVDDSDTTTAAGDALVQMRYIATNALHGFSWQIQAEAAAALVRIDGKLPVAIDDPSIHIHPRLQARLLEALGECVDPHARVILLLSLGETDPLIQTAAMDGLRLQAHQPDVSQSFEDSVIIAVQTLLATNDVAVRAVAASTLRDSLLQRASSVPPLLRALDACRPPYDTEAMVEIMATLGRLHDSRSVQPLMKQLESLDATVAVAAARALEEISGGDFHSRILRRSSPLTTDLDFDFLRSLPTIVHAKLETSRGDIFIDLQRDSAPFTVMSIIKLTEQRGFYRGLLFHRVVPNFVVQGGDPRGDGWGGPGYVLRSEFSMTEFSTGTVGIASAGKDTEGSQFFITLSPQPHLDGRYTVIGSVVGGMDVVNALQVEDRIYDIVVL